MYGVPEAVKNKEGGLWVDPDNQIEKCSSALRRLLSDDKFRQEQGEFGRRRIRREFLANSRLKDMDLVLEGIAK